MGRDYSLAVDGRTIIPRQWDRARGRAGYRRPSARRDPKDSGVSDRYRPTKLSLGVIPRRHLTPMPPARPASW